MLLIIFILLKKIKPNAVFSIICHCQKILKLNTKYDTILATRLHSVHLRMESAKKWNLDHDDDGEIVAEGEEGDDKFLKWRCPISKAEVDDVGYVFASSRLTARYFNLLFFLGAETPAREKQNVRSFI